MRKTRATATDRQVAAAQTCFAEWRDEFESPYPTFNDLPEDQQDKWVRIATHTSSRYTNYRRAGC